MTALAPSRTSFSVLVVSILLGSLLGCRALASEPFPLSVQINHETIASCRGTYFVHYLGNVEAFSVELNILCTRGVFGLQHSFDEAAAIGFFSSAPGSEIRRNVVYGKDGRTIWRDATLRLNPDMESPLLLGRLGPPFPPEPADDGVDFATTGEISIACSNQPYMTSGAPGPADFCERVAVRLGIAGRYPVLVYGDEDGCSSSRPGGDIAFWAVMVIFLVMLKWRAGNHSGSRVL